MSLVDSSEWTMFGHDPQHTGTSPNLLWSYVTGGIVISSPAVFNGKVYVGSFRKQSLLL